MNQANGFEMMSLFNRTPPRARGSAVLTLILLLIMTGEKAAALEPASVRLCSYSLLPGGEVVFSIENDVFSETLGPLQHGVGRRVFCWDIAEAQARYIGAAVESIAIGVAQFNALADGSEHAEP